MQILLVSATRTEIAPLLDNLSPEATSYRYGMHEADVLITGAGMVATAYHLGRRLQQKRYDLALNIGVCGCFHKEIKKGTVVNVVTDHFPEMGAEDGDSFLPWHMMGIEDEDTKPFKKGILINESYPVTPSIKGMREVHGITVNSVHGNRKSIDQIRRLYDPDTESMEGAAFFYACQLESVPCLQIRAVSNLIEVRNRNAWDIPLAIKNLTVKVREILNEL